MKKNYLNFLFIFVFVFMGGVLFFSFSVDAYTVSYPNIARYVATGGTSSFMQNSLAFDKAMCQNGNDFMLQIVPFSCEPSPVRSDLLEEQDVAVYCQIAATQLNPLIDVEAIKSMVITAKSTPGVKNVAYFPSQSALGLVPNGDVSEPLLNNLGYVVIILGKNANESSMPDYVEGNLSARLRYDVQGAFGVGASEFYLPELSDTDFQDRLLQYGFWDGRGYLRAEGINENQATISVYTDAEVSTSFISRNPREYTNLAYSSYTLNKGEESREIYLPGFSPCMAGFTLRLNDLKDPDTTAKIRVNDEIFEVTQGESFFENRCGVLSVDLKGLYKSAEVRCRDDSGKSNSFVLSLSPEVELSLRPEQGVINTSEYGLGDKLYDYKDSNGNKKSVFLGYVGSSDGSKTEDNLFVVLFSVPYEKAPTGKLSNSQLKSVSTFVKYRMSEVDSGNNVVDFLANGFLGANAFLIEGLDWAIKGSDFEVVKYYKPGDKANKDIFKDVEVNLNGFASNGGYETLLDSNPSSKANYSLAMEDFGTVSDFYSDQNPSKPSFEDMGEESLYNSIVLASRAGEKSDLINLCEKFEEFYPNSLMAPKINTLCFDDYFLSNSGDNENNVLIDGDLKSFSLVWVSEPSYEDYGAEVLVKGPKGVSKVVKLEKNEVYYLNEFRGSNSSTGSQEYITLDSLGENSAKLKIQRAKNYEEKEFTSDSINLELNKEKVSGEYSFILYNVNLKKVAKVSINPIVNNQFSNSTFPFKVAIEKRNFKMSPEKISDKIENLNQSIEKLTNRVDFLQKTVEVGNKMCLGVGGYLTVKNLIANMNGASIARTMVMQGKGGWDEYCQQQLAAGNPQYSSLDDCFLKNADLIDGEVSKYQSILENQNSEIGDCEKQATKQNDGSLIQKSYVDQGALVNCYLPNVKTTLSDTLEETGFVKEGEFYGGKDNGVVIGEGIDLSKVDDILSDKAFSENIYSFDQLREIEFYKMALEQNSSDDKARSRLFSLLTDLEKNSETYYDRSKISSSSGIDIEKIGFIKVSENTQDYIYTGLTVKDLINKYAWLGNFSSDTPVYMADTEVGSYIMILKKGSNNEDKMTIQTVGEATGSKNQLYQIYTLGGDLLNSNLNSQIGQKAVFIKRDDTSYKNGYLNPEVRYFDNEAYQGYPAVVPIDTKDGWYAATKSTLPLGGNIAAYDKSGVVKSFWLCNVGENGLEEYISGDDICSMINLNTGEDYKSFYGLDAGTTSKLINRAVNAIEKAQLASKNAKTWVTIDGKRYKVGQPQAEVPAVQCQDFMSPKDCSLMFNFCDPFVCPSSRCDLGGNYPVRDVVQSGVIGSLALCYPNAIWNGGDVYVPICVSGVYTGLDGWLQVKKAYRDCLQQNLDTGETVGICDEVQSIYMCDFFYSQARPILQLGVPKLLSLIKGESTRGGGEYLQVQDAWSKASNSIDYFKQYYAAEAYRAFKLRSVNEVSVNEPCNTFSSIIFPNGGEVLDSLTQARSPVQFTGKFEETSLTTITNPPTSHYKVYYQIYAGQDTGAYWKVYLRGGSGSDYYLDNALDRIVDSGYLSAGDSYFNTKDFQAPSGYKELCIVVNGQQECGFQQVSTSFAVNYLNDLYLNQQASNTDVTTESECISGSASFYQLFNANVQSSVEDMIDPAIYNNGIIRRCATNDPGVGTDINAGTENARWVKVGYCGDANIGCWLDTDSVKDVIRALNLQEDALNSTAAKFQNDLYAEGDYLTPSGFEKAIEETNSLSTPQEKVNKLTDVLGRVFWNSQKSLVTLLRGKAYSQMVQVNRCSDNFCGEDGNLHPALYDVDTGVCNIDYSVISHDCKGNGCTPEGAEGMCNPNPEEPRPGEEGACPLYCSNEDYFVGGLNGKGILYEGMHDENDTCVKTNVPYNYCSSGCSPEGLGGTCQVNSFMNFLLPDFVSSRFEFKDGSLSKNYCYQFREGVWQWKKGCDSSVIISNPETLSSTTLNSELDWIDVSLVGNPNKINEPIIIALQDKSYVGGLKVLFEAVKNKGSRASLVSLQSSTEVSSPSGLDTRFSQSKLSGYNFFENKNNYFYYDSAQGWSWVFYEDSKNSNPQVLHRGFDIESNYDQIIKLSGLGTKDVNFLRWFFSLNYEKGFLVLLGNLPPEEASETSETPGNVITPPPSQTRTLNEILSAMSYASANSLGGRRCDCGVYCQSYATGLYNAQNTYGIDAFLLLALMMQESGCDIDASSSDGRSVGLMQINSYSVCNSIGIYGPSDVTGVEKYENNIACGALILKAKYVSYGSGKTYTCGSFTRSYSGWDAALRGYIGYGCTGDSSIDVPGYVDNVNLIYSTLDNVMKSTSECNLDVGESILSNAELKIGQDTTRIVQGREVYDYVCATFVSNVLIDAGLLPQFENCVNSSIPERDAVIELNTLFGKQEGFVEIPKNQWASGLKPGDVVIWGCKGPECTKDTGVEFQHITIFKGYDNGGARVVHDGGQAYKISEKTYPNLFGDSWYVTHVWRACSNPSKQEDSPNTSTTNTSSSSTSNPPTQEESVDYSVFTQTEQEVIKTATMCEDCGNDLHWYTIGLGNICDEDECNAIGIVTKRNCVYKSGGICVDA